MFTPKIDLSVHIESKYGLFKYPIVDEIGISSWDLRKTLQLFRKSSPSIIEWLQSPIIYLDDNQFAPYLKEKTKKYYSSTKRIYHYRSIAKTNYRGYLHKESVPLKKYFYVLRPLLAILWIEKYN